MFPKLTGRESHPARIGLLDTRCEKDNGCCLVEREEFRSRRQSGAEDGKKVFAASLIVPCAALIVALCSPAAATTTLCVSPHGAGGCFSKINAAVAAAAPFDTIQVAAGEYDEDVIIDKPLSLIGANRETTIIDADDRANGVYVDGIDHPGLRNVVVSGFTIKHANFEGVLVTNASYVTVWDNEVIDNDKSLDPNTPACPGIPSFETAEGFDCGEGIHLIGVAHSIVVKNVVVKNAGGILLSDDTGRTHDNLITDNVVAENPFDCGITLASHPPASIAQSSVPLGVFDNTIARNKSFRNGLGVAGAGAGVGIFDSVPGAKAFGNVVIDNELTDNGLPGVAMHSHTPGQNLDNNIIVGNFISGNGADTDDAATPGTTGINVFGVSPIRGTIIAQNVIKKEQNAIVANTPAQVSAHLNNLLAEFGVANIGTGKVVATENWWGCAEGPSDDDCSRVNGPDVFFTPWLVKPFKGLEHEHAVEEKDHQHGDK